MSQSSIRVWLDREPERFPGAEKFGFMWMICEPSVIGCCQMCRLTEVSWIADEATASFDSDCRRTTRHAIAREYYRVYSRSDPWREHQVQLIKPDEARGATGK